jgi:signal peptidase I
MNQPAPVEPPAETPRETIDSIVIALILAFVFRAFIVEAFVIPTGSMASTLYGAHGTMICRDCGWEYAYGLTDLSSSRDGVFTEASVAICPNCRFANPTVEVNDKRRNYETGDRILVLKWTYDIGGPTLGPQRWDVVVFKDPSDGTTNYIKRLAGMPNEVLQIIDGDVYTVPVAELSAEARATLEEDVRIKYLRRHYAELLKGTAARFSQSDLPRDVAEKMDRIALDALDAQLEPRRQALLAELDRKLTIERKRSKPQEDLWRVVYDHDYPPHEHDAGQPHWWADDDSGWTVGERVLHFEGLGQSDPRAVSLSAVIDSRTAYNTLIRPNLRSLNPPLPVSDLRIRLVTEYHAGAGKLIIRLVKHQDHFATELAADGTLRLLTTTADRVHAWRELARTQVDRLRPDRQVELVMEVRDFRVRVEIDGREVLATTDTQYAPNVGALRQRSSIPATLPPAILATDLDIALHHLRVDRDIYYVSEHPSRAAPLGYHGWGVRNHPIWLRDGEYFMLGDNSAQSKDSRLWDFVGNHLLDRGPEYQLGTVPRDQLIGKAFFVYWPSGLRTSLIPFLRDRGWIPNFGRMRWIR